MEYDEYDKIPTGKKQNQIFDLLRERPYTCDELAKETGLDRSSVFYHLKVLISMKRIQKKLMKKNYYYGLSHKERKNGDN